MNYKIINVDERLFKDVKVGARPVTVQMKVRS